MYLFVPRINNNQSVRNFTNTVLKSKVGLLLLSARTELFFVISTTVFFQNVHFFVDQTIYFRACK